MLPSTKLAIAAHLHVLMRRKVGRVTDIEWMAVNREYAAEVVRIARAKAAEEGHPDLSIWADKLAQAMAEPDDVRRAPLVQKASEALRENRNAASAPPSQLPQEAAAEAGASSFGESTFGESVFGPRRPREKPDPAAPRYVGGIR
jgi:hypothetical protein